MKKKILSIVIAVIIAVSVPAALLAMISWPSQSWPTTNIGESWSKETSINQPTRTESSWVKVSDPNCNKCIMNDTTRKCGKPNCGGFMYSVDGTGSYEKDGYLKYDYKCNKCSHTITYKNK